MLAKKRKIRRKIKKVIEGQYGFFIKKNNSYRANPKIKKIVVLKIKAGAKKIIDNKNIKIIDAVISRVYI